MSEIIKIRYCSFCGKDERRVENLIAGPTVFICTECVVMCVEIIKDRREKKAQEIQQVALSLSNVGKSDE